MIVGRLPDAVMAGIDVPDEVMENAFTPIIQSHKTEVPFGDLWLSCCQAAPHVDTLFRHLMFLNLAVVSTHEYGQIDMPKDRWGQIRCDNVPPGSLFLTDPRKLHWLSCLSFQEQLGEYLEHPGPYVGIQWEIPRQGWKTRVTKILQEIGAIPEMEWRG